jgi:HSP20 family protein
MSMERWNPFGEMDNFRQAMDRWFEDRLPRNWYGNQMGNNLNLPLDVHETEQGYELEASLPGVKADDIDIEINRDQVTIRAKTQSSEERRDENKNYLYRERRAGSFYRTIRLPDLIDTSKADANLEHGILRVNLPRMDQSQSRQRLQVRGSQTGQSQVGGLNQTGMGETGTRRVENSSVRQDQGAMRSGQSTSGISSGATTNTSSSFNSPDTHSSDYGTYIPQNTESSTGTGTVQPGASHGEHSQVDHRSQTGGQSYTSGGYGQSSAGTGNSVEGSGTNQSQSGAGQYGAGQTSGNVGESPTLGNQ